jgi:hypothetical protein
MKKQLDKHVLKTPYIYIYICKFKIYIKENITYQHILRYLVCSHEPELGETQEIITVRELPTKESRSTSVSLLPLKGMCI